MTVSMISPPKTFPQSRSVSVSIRKISLKNSMSPTRMKIAPMNGPSLKPLKLNHRFTYEKPRWRKPSVWYATHEVKAMAKVMW